MSEPIPKTPHDEAMVTAHNEWIADYVCGLQPAFRAGFYAGMKYGVERMVRIMQGVPSVMQACATDILDLQAAADQVIAERS